MPKTFKLSINRSGSITAIYDDVHADLIAKGTAQIRRASHVEPTSDGQWTATMNDGKVLGPYRLRSTALAAEVKYLESKLFGKEPTL
jgi:hypothetical protein